MFLTWIRLLYKTAIYYWNGKPRITYLDVLKRIDQPALQAFLRNTELDLSKKVIVPFSDIGVILFFLKVKQDNSSFKIEEGELEMTEELRNVLLTVYQNTHIYKSISLATAISKTGKLRISHSVIYLKSYLDNNKS